jgi:hypothetical protein
MPGHAPELEHSPEDKANLVAITRSRIEEARVVERARIILACGDCEKAVATSGEWWREDSRSRDEWDVALESVGIYRIFQENVSGRWFVEGPDDR